MKSFLGRIAVVGGLSAAMVFGASGIAGAEPMVASYYGPGFDGAVTASGDIFDSSEHTAAHKTLPFGTELEVCYQGCTVVTVNDRGPFVQGRDLDLSQAAASDIGLVGVGEATVEVTEVGSGSSAASTESTENSESAEPVSSAPASTTGGSTYTVESGDILFGIAERFGTSVEAIIEANDIVNPNLIFPGTELSV